MSNAAIKILTLSIPFLTIMSSCSGSGDKAKAQALYDEASAAYDSNDYSRTLLLTDSIKTAYPTEIDIRRQALHLATRATEGLTVRRLAEADSIVATLGVKADSLSHLVKYVNNPIEGYYTTVKTDPSKIGTITGLQARVSPEGDFYIISTLKGKSVKSTSVSVSCNGQSASTTVVNHDGERNDRSLGAEVITFMGVECDSLGMFIANHYPAPMTLTFNGASSYSLKLPETQAAEIATMYDYATTIRKAKLANIEKERLSRMLEIARTQAAKTYIEPSADEE